MIVGTFRGSSAVEQFPVKELVVGSIPTHGAKSKILRFHIWGFYFSFLRGVSQLLGLR